MVFSATDKSSFQLVNDLLTKFQKLSSLATNPKKSEIFCANVTPMLKAQILSTIQFKEGKLPMKYLIMFR